MRSSTSAPIVGRAAGSISKAESTGVLFRFQIKAVVLFVLGVRAEIGARRGVPS